MPEILPHHTPSPRTALFWDGTAYRPGTIDAAGHIQIDVLSTAMDPLAATAANQALILAQLQLIEDMRDALQSVATDRLQVRGSNQLHSHGIVLASSRIAVISAANGFTDSHVCSAGTVWHVTNISVRDQTNPITFIRLYMVHDGAFYSVGDIVRAIAAAEYVRYETDLWLDEDDFFQCFFQGGLVGDTCRVDLLGEVMTKEV